LEIELEKFKIAQENTTGGIIKNVAKIVAATVCGIAIIVYSPTVLGSLIGILTSLLA